MKAEHNNSVAPPAKATNAGVMPAQKATAAMA
jgi:hypothetical protein